MIYIQSTREKANIYIADSPVPQQFYCIPPPPRLLSLKLVPVPARDLGNILFTLIICELVNMDYMKKGDVYNVLILCLISNLTECQICLGCGFTTVPCDIKNKINTMHSTFNNWFKM